MTLRVSETARFLVLLADPVTESLVSSVISAMLLRGRASGPGAERRQDPVAFLTHLLLRENARELDDRRSEKECDRRAFEQMEIKHAVQPRVRE